MCSFSPSNCVLLLYNYSYVGSAVTILLKHCAQPNDLARMVKPKLNRRSEFTLMIITLCFTF